MNRTPVNPWEWSLKHGYNQAEILDSVSRQLVCAGQTSVDADGNPMHPGDCLLYTSPSPRDATLSRMPSSA